MPNDAITPFSHAQETEQRAQIRLYEIERGELRLGIVNSMIVLLSSALLLHRHVPQPSKSILFVPMLAAPLDRGSLRNAKVSLTRVLNFDGTLSEKG